MRSVRWSSLALDDLRGIGNYIALNDPVAADKTVSVIRESVRRLRSWPRSAPNLDVEGFRKLTVAKYPYVVLYTIDDTHIVVVRVHHSSRDWRPV
jgi:toxin ParE1/3/4